MLPVRREGRRQGLSRPGVLPFGSVRLAAFLAGQTGASLGEPAWIEYEYEYEYEYDAQSGIRIIRPASRSASSAFQRYEREAPYQSPRDPADMLDALT